MSSTCVAFGAQSDEAPSFFHDLRVHAVALDRFGRITAANEGWKRFADQAQMKLPNHGIGENYLRHCAFADPTSPRLIRGISQLLAGQAETFSLLYPCHSATEQRWFLLCGFPHSCETCAVALMHIEVTAIVSSLIQAGRPTDAPTTGRGAPESSPPPEHEVHRMIDVIEQSLASSIADIPAAAAAERVRSGLPADAPPKTALSKRQREVLALIAQGLTNASIAKRLGLSEHTVKIHVSGVLARLGLESRAQAMHWVHTRGRAEN